MRHALLALLYNTGARIQEALDLCPQAVRLESPAQVRLVGKGRKERLCPIWPETAELLAALLRRQPRASNEAIFVNRYGRPLGASGFRFQLRRYVQAAAKFPKACECLEKDKEVLFTFYDFPAQHWPHLRTTNPIESTFATVRLRTHRTKGSGSRIATLTMVFKLGLEAQKHWRRLQGFELIPKVVTGVRFVDGEEQTQQAA
jgi:integrase